MGRVQNVFNKMFLFRNVRTLSIIIRDYSELSLQAEAYLTWQCRKM